ncbi:hypothetical protein THASP1DRAFT_28261 [Thamnocephalis sphaerospora]|uniref:Uncharacterized protein n=1 Tax=Thamnocephalis sphaerospora TaxID=78915 RepID=A0A4V1IX61_9FUNG|nr:hypothetical protein THASP1DRAFT_28261 [Thamnocephalis sphaerospora]|eukprot:RKP09939.1 hypothetical protein THASP1DRAFT_28261 [Thamnocephalis sphaerospora]
MEGQAQSTTSSRELLEVSGNKSLASRLLVEPRKATEKTGKVRSLDDESNQGNTSADEYDADEMTMTLDTTGDASLPLREKPAITRMQAPSDLLSRVAAFLPQMASANAKLQQEIASSGDAQAHDIEAVDEDAEQYIEMNLGLGVFEEKRADGSASDDEVAVDIQLPGVGSTEEAPGILVVHDSGDEDSDADDDESMDED